MPESFQTAAYVGASFLFILSLRGLSSQETARRGNTLGTLGMAIAVVVTLVGLFSGDTAQTTSGASIGLLAGAIAVGCSIGAWLASRVKMEAMPELVAVLHSFVGLAAVLVGLASLIEHNTGRTISLLGIKVVAGKLDAAHLIEILIGAFVGAITFTGSVIAFLKLRGTVTGKALHLPGRHLLNLAGLAGVIVASVFCVRAEPQEQLTWLLAVIGISGVMGVHLVLAIGGGDMPVVVSLLNSYSGWAASAAGFMLENDLLIITGALVGSSGAILSFIMCKAMNRSIWNVVFGGFGTEAQSARPAGAGGPVGEVRSTNAEDTAQLLLASRSVVIVPGYGMAVAQAQHAVKEIASVLQGKGVKVQFAIHPVAGRLPGHMNVLLAEAGVGYEIVKEMDEVQGELGHTDLVVVIGANDIVNPSALEDPGSPIFGMPVLEVWRAAKVIMLKRGMAAGYAGVDNPLCYRENTLMLFGDAKQSVNKLLDNVRGASREAA
jgi:H+-translocating NAD(P) transhydrogenase subunit beta